MNTTGILLLMGLSILILYARHFIKSKSISDLESDAHKRNLKDFYESTGRINGILDSITKPSDKCDVVIESFFSETAKKEMADMKLMAYDIERALQSKKEILEMPSLTDQEVRMFCLDKICQSQDVMNINEPTFKNRLQICYNFITNKEN